MSRLKSGDHFTSDYILVEFIGSGGYSEVWKAKHTLVTSRDHYIAIKIYAPEKGLDADGVKIFMEEYMSVNNLRHTFLLKANQFSVYEDSPYLILDYCKNGSALKKIDKMSEGEMAVFIQQAASALGYLHEQEPPIIHQDIKPDNFLIDDKGNFLLADFGISTQIRHTLTRSMGESSQKSGTMPYMAPERFGKFPNPTKECDIWSLGATIYELLTSSWPFGEFGGLTQKNGADLPDISGKCSIGMQSIIEACMSIDPATRPTAKDLEEIATNYLKTGNWQTIKTLETKPIEKPKPELKRKGRETASMPFTPEFKPTSSQSSSQSSMPNLSSIPAAGKKHFWLILIIIVCALLVISIFVSIIRNNGHTAEEKAVNELRKQDSIAKSDSIAKATAEFETMAKNPSSIPASSNNIFNYATVYVAGGTFQMGSNDGEPDEKPVHSVSVNGFSIGKYEVTQAQWRSVMGSNPSNFKGCDDCPVENVSWKDTQGFIKKVKEVTGKTYRLPTEAEWEYAARGGSKIRGYKYSGSDNIGSVAWYTDNSGGKTHPVGQKSSNKLGIYDMSGNVWEWCSDWKKGYPGSNGVEDYTGSERVNRGGCWKYDATDCAVDNRSSTIFGGRYSTLGFRLVFVP